jgi:hypothetical protein
MDPLSRLNIRLAYEHGIIEYPELCKLLSEQAFCVRPADQYLAVRSSHPADAPQSSASKEAK